MSWKEIILEQGSKILENPALMRWVTDDRVMKAAEGLMDAPMRMKAALKILKDGYELPNVDPALDDDPVPAKNGARNGAVNGGTTGSSKEAEGAGSEDMEESMSQRRSLATIGGKDVFEKCFKFTAADNARKRGIYPFFRPLDLNDGPEAEIDGKRVIMFGSNNYL